jgi:hypothetical protein
MKHEGHRKQNWHQEVEKWRLLSVTMKAWRRRESMMDGSKKNKKWRLSSITMNARRRWEEKSMASSNKEKKK